MLDIFDPFNFAGKTSYTREEREGFSNLLNLGFVDTFRKLYPKTVKYSFFYPKGNTRFKNQGCRLDYFLVSSSMMKAVENSEILDKYYGSDHLPIKLTFDVKKIDPPTPYVITRLEISETKSTEEEQKEPEEEYDLDELIMKIKKQ